MVKKYAVTTSKIIVEYWEVEADDEVEAELMLWKKGKKIDEEVHEYHIDEVTEI